MADRGRGLEEDRSGCLEGDLTEGSMWAERRVTWTVSSALDTSSASSLVFLMVSESEEESEEDTEEEAVPVPHPGS